MLLQRTFMLAFAFAIMMACVADGWLLLKENEEGERRGAYGQEKEEYKKQVRNGGEGLEVNEEREVNENDRGTGEWRRIKEAESADEGREVAEKRDEELEGTFNKRTGDGQGREKKKD